MDEFVHCLMPAMDAASLSTLMVCCKTLYSYVTRYEKRILIDTIAHAKAWCLKKIDVLLLISSPSYSRIVDMLFNVFCEIDAYCARKINAHMHDISVLETKQTNNYASFRDMWLGMKTQKRILKHIYEFDTIERDIMRIYYYTNISS